MSLFIFSSGSVFNKKCSENRAKTPFVLFAENNTHEDSDIEKGESLETDKKKTYFDSAAIVSSIDSTF